MEIRRALETDALGIATVQVRSWQAAYVLDCEVAGWIAFGPTRNADAAANTGELEASRRDAAFAERGVTTVTLWGLLENTRVIRFYRAAGFAPNRESEKQIIIGGQPLMEIRYEINLG